MVNNCATFVIMLLGIILLRERASLSSFTMLLISFAATVLVLFGADVTGASTSDVNGSSGSGVLGLVFLLANPVIIAVGMISMRSMRKMHEAVVTSYMNLMLLVVMMTVIVAQGSDLSPWSRFSVVDWVMLAFLATTNVGSQTFRFRAI